MIEREMLMLQIKSGVQVTSEKMVRGTLPVRESSGHKGTFGTSLLVAGSDEMPGSAALVAIGAIRSGTGRLVIATSERALPIVSAHVPEATFITDGVRRISEGDIPPIDAVGIGPGLIEGTKTKQALEQLFQLGVPVVVDAGALEERTNWRAQGPVIITPHPGEFSRMTGYTIAEIEDNREEFARSFAMRHEVTVVLKGKHTVISFPSGETFINPTGNTSLAKGGSGDVLTGMLTSFLATHKQLEYAVINAVYIHGLCASLWAEKHSEATMTASDFATLLPVVLKRLEPWR